MDEGKHRFGAQDGGLAVRVRHAAAELASGRAVTSVRQVPKVLDDLAEILTSQDPPHRILEFRVGGRAKVVIQDLLGGLHGIVLQEPIDLRLERTRKRGGVYCVALTGPELFPEPRVLDRQSPDNLVVNVEVSTLVQPPQLAEGGGVRTRSCS